MTSFAVKHPHLTLFLVMLVLTPAIFGIKNLSTTKDTRVFFRDDNPQLMQLQAFEQKYEQNNTLLIVIKTRQNSVFDQPTLQLIDQLGEKAWRLPYARRVDSLVNFPDILGLNDDIIVRDFITNINDLETSELERLEAKALADPSIVNRLVSHDGKTTAIIVNFNIPRPADEEIEQIMSQTNAMVKSFEKSHPNYEYHITGNIRLMNVFAYATKRDFFVLIPLTLTATALVTFFLLRSWTLVLILFSTLALSSLTASGIAGWTNQTINPASALTPLVIFVLGLASAIHIVTSTLLNLQSGEEKKQAILKAATKTLPPILLTSLTTTIGFSAFNFSDAPPFQQLGNFVIVGIVTVFFLNFTWLPALLRLNRLPANTMLGDHTLSTIGQAVYDHKLASLSLSLLLFFTTIMGLNKLEIDDDFIRNFDSSFQYRISSDFVEDNLTGLNIIEFDVPSGSENGIYDPEFLNTVDRFSTWLRQQPKVSNAVSIIEPLKKIHTALSPKESLSHNRPLELPDNRKQIAQYLLLYELSLPAGQELTDQINVTRSNIRISVLLHHATSANIRQLNTAAQNWLLDNAAPEMQTSGTSINVVFAHLSNNTIQSMITGTILSVLIISALIGWRMKSMSIGVISLFANALPIIAGFGIWGLLFQQMGLAAAAIAAMTFGIVVDDTVHFLMSYRNERLINGVLPREAIKRTFTHVGTAMWSTTAILVIGFSVLTLSGFVVNRTLAFSTLIILQLALIADFFLLPPILSLLDRNRKSGPTDN